MLTAILFSLLSLTVPAPVDAPVDISTPPAPPTTEVVVEEVIDVVPTPSHKQYAWRVDPYTPYVGTPGRPELIRIRESDGLSLTPFVAQAEDRVDVMMSVAGGIYGSNVRCANLGGTYLGVQSAFGMSWNVCVDIDH